MTAIKNFLQSLITLKFLVKALTFVLGILKSKKA